MPLFSENVVLLIVALTASIVLKVIVTVQYREVTSSCFGKRGTVWVRRIAAGTGIDVASCL